MNIIGPLKSLIDPFFPGLLTGRKVGQWNEVAFVSLKPQNLLKMCNFAQGGLGRKLKTSTTTRPKERPHGGCRDRRERRQKATQN